MQKLIRKYSHKELIQKFCNLDQTKKDKNQQMKSSNSLIFNLEKSLISKEVCLLAKPHELSPQK